MAADPWQLRGPLLRTVLSALAVLVVLGSGVDDLPRAVADQMAAPAASAAALPHDGTAGSTPAAVVRPGGLAAVPAPTSPGTGLLPAPHPHVAPRLVAEPASRPPTPRAAAAAVLAAGGRAPPAPAGP